MTDEGMTIHFTKEGEKMLAKMLKRAERRPRVERWLRQAGILATTPTVCAMKAHKSLPGQRGLFD